MHDTQIPAQANERHDARVERRNSSSAGEIPLTTAAQVALERELEGLRDQRNREIPARLRAAREFGDSANNDDYLAIREDEALLAARIARLDDILTRAVVADPGNADDTVAIGSQVSVVDIQTGETLNYLIDGAHGTRGPGTASALSPVGKALLGRISGERVRVELPNRRARELELRDVHVARAA